MGEHGAERGVHVVERWKQRARHLKGLVYALYLAYRDPRTPWLARVVAACVVGYAFSPIDLIPDPIPILGYLDDLVLLPLGVALAVRLLPPAVWAEAQHQAAEMLRDHKPVNRVAAVVIVAVWLAIALAGVLLLRHWFLS